MISDPKDIESKILLLETLMPSWDETCQIIVDIKYKNDLISGLRTVFPELDDMYFKTVADRFFVYGYAGENCLLVRSSFPELMASWLRNECKFPYTVINDERGIYK